MNNYNKLKTEILEIIYKSEYKKAIKESYKTKFIFNKEKNKLRKIEKPNDILKKNFQKLLTIALQNNIERPVYCMSAWKGTNNILNASIHAGKKFTITLDLEHYFFHSKTKYVENFWQSLDFHGKDLDRLMRLTTFNGHLPTGAPTSNILAALIHKSLFDEIYKEMQRLDITFSIYVDDITLSSNKHMSNSVIQYIEQVLKTHKLHLNVSKIKKFGYKGAFITGIKTTQSGKLQMPFKQGHKVIKMINEKSIEKMNEEELLKLIGKIGYIQQINPNGIIKTKCSPTDIKKQNYSYFYVTKQKAFKQLNKIIQNSKT